MLEEQILDQVKQVIGLVKYPVEFVTSLDYSEPVSYTHLTLPTICSV